MFASDVQISDVGYSNNRGIAYGVNSIDGPIILSPDANDRFVRPGGRSTFLPEDLREGQVLLGIDEFHSIKKGVQEQAWEEAFTQSKGMVIDNRESMQKIRAERNAVLDKALDVVVQPINLDTPPKA